MSERQPAVGAPVEPSVRPHGGEIAETLAKALRRAYHLGQTYWQQADSESYAQNRRADETQRKFEALASETRDALFAHCREVEQGTRHACSIAVWMTLQDALADDADDKGLDGWMREAEQRVKLGPNVRGNAHLTAAQEVEDEQE